MEFLPKSLRWVLHVKLLILTVLHGFRLHLPHICFSIGELAILWSHRLQFLHVFVLQILANLRLRGRPGRAVMLPMKASTDSTRVTTRTNWLLWTSSSKKSIRSCGKFSYWQQIYISERCSCTSFMTGGSLRCGSLTISADEKQSHASSNVLSYVH